VPTNSRPTSAQAHSRPTSAQARKNSRPSSAARIDNRSRSGSAKTRPGTASTTTYPLEQSVQFYNVDGGSRPRSSSSSSSSAVNQANMATPPLGAFASAMNYDDEVYFSFDVLLLMLPRAVLQIIHFIIVCIFSLSRISFVA
jgi:hypothetical protein